MAEECAKEIDTLLSRVFRDMDRAGHLDMEATEMGIRTSMHHVGGVFLEKLINADQGGHQGPRINCAKGHEADFVGYRTKEVTTVLSPVSVRRAYYHCEICEEGIIPKDRDLDMVSTSFSPGVRRMMGRVGSKEPFEEGRNDLEEMAGIRVNTKEVERVSETLGEQIEDIAQVEREAALEGTLLPLLPPISLLYIAVDGTGVPMVKKETQGRAGKDESGQAKTREAKLGCVFTQTSVDEEGYAVREENSTTYVGAIETSEEFGGRIYAEAVRRGILRAQKVVGLGDGAVWIWELMTEHFPQAIQIVDFYHALEHLEDVAKIAYGQGSRKAHEWADAAQDLLKTGDIETILATLQRMRPSGAIAQEKVRTTMGYFQNNMERMRYAKFRSQGLFIGSGVIEAGCRTIVGQRLKQSGMHWTVRGANAILSLRCCHLSNRWEDFWAARAAA